MTSVKAPDGKGNAPVNALDSARAFARPSDRTVVAPNHDTLYSLAQLDLGKGPIVLSHPNMGRRYFDFESSTRTPTSSTTSARARPARTRGASRSPGPRSRAGGYGVCP